MILKNIDIVKLDTEEGGDDSSPLRVSRFALEARSLRRSD